MIFEKYQSRHLIGPPTSTIFVTPSPSPVVSEINSENSRKRSKDLPGLEIVTN